MAEFALKQQNVLLEAVVDSQGAIAAVIGGKTVDIGSLELVASKAYSVDVSLGHSASSSRKELSDFYSTFILREAAGFEAEYAVPSETPAISFGDGAQSEDEQVRKMNISASFEFYKHK